MCVVRKCVFHPSILLSLANLSQEYVHVAFYVASALALAPALVIFFAYKQVIHSYAVL